jgi:hypothetical protein
MNWDKHKQKHFGTRHLWSLSRQHPRGTEKRHGKFQKWSQDFKQVLPNMSLECYHYINLFHAIYGVVDEKKTDFIFWFWILLRTIQQYSMKVPPFATNYGCSLYYFILYRTTCFGLYAGHLQVLSDKSQLAFPWLFRYIFFILFL